MRTETEKRIDAALENLSKNFKGKIVINIIDNVCSSKKESSSSISHNDIVYLDLAKDDIKGNDYSIWADHLAKAEYLLGEAENSRRWKLENPNFFEYCKYKYNSI